MAIDLDGAVACVTGGGRGIGRATAAVLAARGARVWIGDLDGEAAEGAAAELGDRVRAAQLDVADGDSFAAFVAAAEADGPLSLLVNNAGIMSTGPFVEQDPEVQKREIEVNLGGVVTGMRLVLPGMVARNRGHVVNVASMAGRMTVPGASVYSATKFAVTALSRTVRAELAGTEVTLTTVMPAAVRTDLSAGLDLRGVPTVEAGDVARAVVASCRHGRREVAVPRWVRTPAVVVEAFPEPLGELAKRALRAQDRINPDNDERRRYSQRVGGGGTTV